MKPSLSEVASRSGRWLVDLCIAVDVINTHDIALVLLKLLSKENIQN